jgi:hypothetical protein
MSPLFQFEGSLHATVASMAAVFDLRAFERGYTNQVSRDRNCRTLNLASMRNLDTKYSVYICRRVNGEMGRRSENAGIGRLGHSVRPSPACIQLVAHVVDEAISKPLDILTETAKKIVRREPAVAELLHRRT